MSFLAREILPVMPRTQTGAGKASRPRVPFVAVLLLAACQPAADDAGSGSETGDPLTQGQVAARKHGMPRATRRRPRLPPRYPAS